MNERDEEQLRKLLKNALSPVADTDLKQDLWPRMLTKLDESTIRVSWLDWALMALVSVWFILFPQVIPALLYYL